ncbi:MAG: hypothetical protein ABI655_10475 [Phenylobacterium sp.]
MQNLPLPPSITLRAASVGVAVLEAGGVTVEVNLPMPRSFAELPDTEVVARYRRLAHDALVQAAEALEA